MRISETGESMLTLEYQDRHASIFLDDDHPRVVIVQSRTEYTPIETFKTLFNRVTNIADTCNANKIIFDKQSLRVFNPLAMQWYFTVWKEEMYEKGIRSHRKILPNDSVFCQSAMMARSRLYALHTEAKFHQMDIKYCESVSSALNI